MTDTVVHPTTSSTLSEGKEIKIISGYSRKKSLRTMWVVWVTKFQEFFVPKMKRTKIWFRRRLQRKKRSDSAFLDNDRAIESSLSLNTASVQPKRSRKWWGFGRKTSVNKPTTTFSKSGRSCRINSILNSENIIKLSDIPEATEDASICSPLVQPSHTKLIGVSESQFSPLPPGTADYFTSLSDLVFEHSPLNMSEMR
jgi:hypothetical protein